MCGAVPPLPQYAFTAYLGRALTLPLINYTVLNSKQDNL